MTKHLLLMAGAAALGVLLTSGCGEAGDPDQDVASVVVSPGNTSILVGATRQYTASPRDDQGRTVSGQTITWSSSNPAAASIDENGLATARAAGTTTITATAQGVEGTSVLTVTTTPVTGQHLVAVGGTLQRGPASSALPVAYTVEAQDGTTPLPGVQVLWTVVDGGGSVTTGSTVTDAGGRASITHTLGATVGDQHVLARAPSLTPADTNQRNVTFSAEALTPGAIVPLATIPIPPNYGIHDTFVREGIAFVFAWDSGVRIFDVGNGIRGGSPSRPVLISRVVTQGGQAHNGWWFHNPNNAEKKYLFVGEEGPGLVGSTSSGDLHVIDVSDLAAPVEVASLSIPGAGAHNFWMDEQNEILYAAFYNGGVVALDVSGTLTGSLASRIIDQVAPGTLPYFWGVQLANGSLYASDMNNGLWQLSTSAGDLGVAGGGNNVTERFTSDLWIHGTHAYTGTWGGFPRTPGTSGNALKVWQLGGAGAPTLIDSVITANVGTVSDVEVTLDGSLLMFSTEGGSGDGFQFYSLANPASPAFLNQHLIGTGIHTATFGYIGGRLYAFGAKNPASPALVILDVTDVNP